MISVRLHLILVRLHFCLKRMWADLEDDLEQNSEVSLEEGDFIKKTSKKKNINHENTHGTYTASDISSLMTMDLSGLEEDIMSVHNQIIDKELTLSDTAWQSSIPSPQYSSKKTLASQGMLTHNK